MFRRHKALMGRIPSARHHSSNSNNASSRISSRAQPRQPGSSFRPRRGSSANGNATASGSSLASHPHQSQYSHLPSVPILSTHPSDIVADAFFAGDRPLLEAAVPPSQRQQPAQQRQSLEELLDEALQWFDAKEVSKGSSTSANVAAEAQVELDKQTPFVPPQEPQRRKLSYRRRRLAPRHDQAQQFLQSMHQRLEHQDEDARLALDKFFHAGQKLSELLPSAKQSKNGKYMSGAGSKGKVLTAEDVQELLQITSAAMEHWSGENGSTKLFTMEKDPQSGVWTSTENANMPSALGSSSKSAAPELDESEIEEEHVIVLDQHGRQQYLGDASASGTSSGSNPSSLAEAISHFVRNLPEDVAFENTSSSPASHGHLSKPGQRPKGGMGRRITLGPRLITARGCRAVPRARKTLEQLLGWTGIRADSVKKKRRRKMSKHKYKKRRKATRALRKRLGK